MMLNKNTLNYIFLEIKSNGDLFIFNVEVGETVPKWSIEFSDLLEEILGRNFHDIC